MPDVIVGYRGMNFLLEIKTVKGRMTADEMCFMDKWRGHYAVVRTVDQAIATVTNPTEKMVMEF